MLPYRKPKITKLSNPFRVIRISNAKARNTYHRGHGSKDVYTIVTSFTLNLLTVMESYASDLPSELSIVAEVMSLSELSPS